MALTKGVNSYVTLAEANIYFEDRLDVSAWTAATDAQKSQALVTATMLLDSQDWLGTVRADNQSLAFPRAGTYNDPKLGKDIELSDTVPNRIINAVFELAHHLLNNDGLLDDTGTVSELSVGQINLNIRSSPQKIPSFIKKNIRPLLANAGNRLWWRAN